MEYTETDNEERWELIITKNKKTKQTKIIGDYSTHRSKTPEYWDVTDWHKPISEMFKEITGSGLEVINIVEPKPLKEMAKTSPLDYSRLLKVPEFLVFKLKKR